MVDPGGRAMGASSVRLYAAKDSVAAIALNGPAVVATIGQPGFVARYTFTGTAGATVTVTATDATLPDRCSPLKLVDTVGRVLDSGCVINGSGGIDKATLPANGTYAVVVDPSGDATGTVTLSLRG